MSRSRLAIVMLSSLGWIVVGCQSSLPSDEPPASWAGVRKDAAVPRAGTDGTTLSLLPEGSAGSPIVSTVGAGSPAPDVLGVIPRPLASYTPPKVVISEIMYHAVLDEGPADEEYEWIEIANRSDAVVNVAGWKLAGVVQFTFAAKTLAKGQHLVIAKSPQKVTELWKLPAGSVVGPFTGALDNGGGRVSLEDGTGTVVDTVPYKDKAPWPMGADAMGAGVAWLPIAVRPLSNHRFKGYSIERISYETSPLEPVNWTTSKLDASTPAQPYADLGKHQIIVENVRHVPGGDDQRLQARANEEVTVKVLFSAPGTLKAPEIEYFVDDIEKTSEPLLKVPMQVTGQGWEAQLPGQPDNSIVRYRVRGDRGDGRSSVVGPRDSDPYGFYAYFVGPDLPGKAPAYQIFIARANWGLLHSWVTPGRATGCVPNPNWTTHLPAVLVYDGKVIDIEARIQGSPYNRIDGPPVPAWPADKLPSGVVAANFKALSWRLYLPRYAPIDGSNAVVLSKRASACGFLTSNVGGRLFESVGVPSSQVGFARVYVNGSYIHFMEKFEHPDGDLLKRFFGKTHVVGDLFKVTGWNGEQGPYTWADGRDLSVKACTKFTPEQLYSYNYDRKTLSYKTNANEVMNLIKDFQTAKAAGPDALKKHFMESWDFPSVLNYIAVINWLVPYDDFFQNHYLYRKADGKWMFMPWDFDLMMGGFQSDEDRLKPLTPQMDFAQVSAQSSFYIGELGNHSNRVDGQKWNNFLKDAFIKTFRTQLQVKWRELAASKLQPAVIDKFIAESLVGYDFNEARTALSKSACDPGYMVKRLKSFTLERNARIAAGLFD